MFIRIGHAQLRRYVEVDAVFSMLAPQASLPRLLRVVRSRLARCRGLQSNQHISVLSSASGFSGLGLCRVRRHWLGGLLQDRVFQGLGFAGFGFQDQ